MLIVHKKSPLESFFETFKVSPEKSQQKLKKFFKTGEWDTSKKEGKWNRLNLQPHHLTLKIHLV